LLPILPNCLPIKFVPSGNHRRREYRAIALEIERYDRNRMILRYVHRNSRRAGEQVHESGGVCYFVCEHVAESVL
jgi:hypothetical protein